MLSEKEANSIKNQLTLHIDSSFPEDKKLEAKSKIQAMNNEELEIFLAQNKLLREEKSSEEPSTVFRKIINKEINSYKIDENKDSLAVLEINPVSKGHVILIPKKEVHSIEKMPSSIFSLAKKISRKIQSKLKPKQVGIASSNTFGEFIINVFPIYENESINSQRYAAEKEELQEIQKKLEIKERKKSIKPRKKKSSENLKKIRLPKRIP